jgi:hypothetical protein
MQGLIPLLCIFVNAGLSVIRLVRYQNHKAIGCQNQFGTDKSDADAGSISLDDDFHPLLIQRNDAKIIF